MVGMYVCVCCFFCMQIDIVFVCRCIFFRVQVRVFFVCNLLFCFHVHMLCFRFVCMCFFICVCVYVMFFSYAGVRVCVYIFFSCGLCFVCMLGVVRVHLFFVCIRFFFLV